MESMIDFRRFRLCEREDFIALSNSRCPGAMSRRDAIAAGRRLSILSQGFLIGWTGYDRHGRRRDSSPGCRAALPQHTAVRLCRLCLTVARTKIFKRLCLHIGSGGIASIQKVAGAEKPKAFRTVRRHSRETRIPSIRWARTSHTSTRLVGDQDPMRFTDSTEACGLIKPRSAADESE